MVNIFSAGDGRTAVAKFHIDFSGSVSGKES